MTVSPKKRLTKRRAGNRRSQKHGKVTAGGYGTCTTCGAPLAPHRICSTCGYYRGEKILAKLV